MFAATDLLCENRTPSCLLCYDMKSYEQRTISRWSPCRRRTHRVDSDNLHPAYPGVSRSITRCRTPEADLSSISRCHSFIGIAAITGPDLHRSVHPVLITSILFLRRRSFTSLLSCLNNFFPPLDLHLLPQHTYSTHSGIRDIFFIETL